MTDVNQNHCHAGSRRNGFEKCKVALSSCNSYTIQTSGPDYESSKIVTLHDFKIKSSRREKISRFWSGSPRLVSCPFSTWGSWVASIPPRSSFDCQWSSGGNTDLYAFRIWQSQHDYHRTPITVPAQLPVGGPNYYGFGRDVRYESTLTIDATKHGDDDADLHFTVNEDPSILTSGWDKQNLKVGYLLERSMNGGVSFETHCQWRALCHHPALFKRQQRRWNYEFRTR